MDAAKACIEAVRSSLNEKSLAIYVCLCLLYVADDPVLCKKY